MVYTPPHRRTKDSKIPCQYCNKLTTQPTGPELQKPHSYTVQHVLPRRRGGHSNKENLKDCCKNCNDVLAILDDCPGALACWRGVAVKLHLPDTASGAKGAHRRIRKREKLSELLVGRKINLFSIGKDLTKKQQRIIQKLHDKLKRLESRKSSMIITYKLTPEQEEAERVETELAISKFKQELNDHPEALAELDKYIDTIKIGNHNKCM